MGFILHPGGREGWSTKCMKVWLNVYCWHRQSHDKDQGLSPWQIGNAFPHMGLSCSKWQSLLPLVQVWKCKDYWSVCTQTRNFSFLPQEVYSQRLLSSRDLLLLGLANCAEVPSGGGIGVVPSNCIVHLIHLFSVCLSIPHPLVAPVRVPDQSCVGCSCTLNTFSVCLNSYSIHSRY